MDSTLKSTIEYHSIWKKGDRYYCKFWEIGGGLCKARITKSTYEYLKKLGHGSKQTIKTIIED